jgi:hypothetical protein
MKTRVRCSVHRSVRGGGELSDGWMLGREIEGSVVDRSGERGEKEEVLDMIR